MKKKQILVLVALSVGLVLGSGVVAAYTDNVNDHQITICHAEGNGGFTSPNPTKKQTSGDNGHGNQNGVHPNDIIPPFVAGGTGGSAWAAFTGQNWTAPNQEFYDNGCKPKVTPSTLSVAKKVVNDDSGTLMSNEFGIYVNGVLLSDVRAGGGSTAESETRYLVPGTKAGTEYTVTEENKSGYTQTSIECVDTSTEQAVAHPVVLKEGQSVLCTVTNTDTRQSNDCKEPSFVFRERCYTPVGCPEGTTIADYKDPDTRQEPICKGEPTEVENTTPEYVFTPDGGMKNTATGEVFYGK